MRNNLATEIQQQLNDRKFRRLLLAVSGGLDSICLAHYFITNRDVLGVEWLGIAHVNHGLRAGSADLDEKLVRDFATAYGIPFFCAHLDGAALKSAEGSLEENARDARYDALRNFAEEALADAILTAHHAGDQAETVYMRLRRGTTLAGLRGMQSIRQTAKTPIYRPFLNVPREELRDYARKNSLTWREDESNTDTKFTRNLVRQKLLPALEETNAGASAQLSRIATLADNVYRKAIEAANRIFEPMVVAAVNWPFEANISPYKKVFALNAAKVSAFAEMTKVSAGMAELFRLWLDSRGFRFPVGTFDTSAQPSAFTSTSYRTRFIEKCRNIIWIYDSALCQKQNNLYFLSDKQRFSDVEGVWRAPMDGDVLTPPDSKIKSRPLKQWLQEKGIPHWVRPSLQVFAQGSQILFVSGICIKKV